MKNFELYLVGAIGLVFALFVACAVGIERSRNAAAVAMQQAGADPLDIPCAIGRASESYCELRAVTRAAK